MPFNPFCHQSLILQEILGPSFSCNFTLPQKLFDGFLEVLIILMELHLFITNNWWNFQVFHMDISRM